MFAGDSESDLDLPPMWKEVIENRHREGVGLIGGMSWESSLNITGSNELVRERLGGLHSASIMHSVDFADVELQQAGCWEEAGRR